MKKSSFAFGILISIVGICTVIILAKDSQPRHRESNYASSDITAIQSIKDSSDNIEKNTEASILDLYDQNNLQLFSGYIAGSYTKVMRVEPVCKTLIGQGIDLKWDNEGCAMFVINNNRYILSIPDLTLVDEKSNKNLFDQLPNSITYIKAIDGEVFVDPATMSELLGYLCQPEKVFPIDD